jgi:hypothetical protein
MANPESTEPDYQVKPRSWFAARFGSADAWTALATLFLVGVGIWGVLETRRTLELSERAWLATIGGQVTAPLEKTRAIHYAINFSNSGREPAADLNIRTEISMIDAYDPEYTDMTNIKVAENNVCLNLEPIRKRAVIAPNLTFAFTNDTLRGTPSIVADDAIIKGSKFLVINGCVAYKSLERTHHTSFCYIIESRDIKPQNQNVTVVLTPGQPPVSVPVTSPAPTPGGGRNYNFVPCYTGFEAD